MPERNRPHCPARPAASAGLRLLATVCLMTTLAILAPATVPAKERPKPEELVVNGGFVVHSSGNLRYRQDELFIPASTLKILTALVALERLGGAYRFETHLWLDSDGALTIKGYGDPTLTSEAVLDIAVKLAALGVRRVVALRLDDTAFDLAGEMAGEENSPHGYDAPNGALAVNFNSVPLTVGKNGNVTTVDSPPPLLPLVREMSVGLAPGQYRRNIAILGGDKQRPPALRYVAELFTAQLRAAGIAVSGSWQPGKAPPGTRPLLVHQSTSPLEEIIRHCLEFSTNFTANQLFLAIGAKEFGLPATWGKGRRAVTAYAAATLGLGEKHLVVREGAGLSRHNRISAAAFLPILERFRPYAHLLHEKDGVPLKSGTLSGVYCYAGYFRQEEALVPFALLLNQEENTRARLLALLQEGAKAATSAR